MDAYALTDRGTWISFENKGDLVILVEGDEAMFNQYGVILVNPEHCPNINAKAAQAFIDWITGEAGQQAIAGFTLNDQQLFFPNAGQGRAEAGCGSGPVVVHAAEARDVVAAELLARGRGRPAVRQNVEQPLQRRLEIRRAATAAGRSARGTAARSRGGTGAPRG